MEQERPRKAAPGRQRARGGARPRWRPTARGTEGCTRPAAAVSSRVSRDRDAGGPRLRWRGRCAGGDAPRYRVSKTSASRR